MLYFLLQCLIIVSFTPEIVHCTFISIVSTFVNTEVNYKVLLLEIRHQKNYKLNIDPNTSNPQSTYCHHELCRH